jgi:hypothetical protein
MKSLIAGIATIALLLGTGICQAQTAPNLSVEVDKSNWLIPTGIQVEHTATGIVVSGRVVKRHERRGRILGHVDIALVDAQGQAVSLHRAALQGFRPSRKNPDWAGFSTHIEPLPAGITGLRVGYGLDG